MRFGELRPHARMRNTSRRRTFHGNLADGRPCPVGGVPYTPPGEAPWGAPSATPVSARGSPAHKPRFGAARAVMQAGAAATQIGGYLRSGGGPVSLAKPGVCGLSRRV
jgi:hypothetical protein